MKRSTAWVAILAVAAAGAARGATVPDTAPIQDWSKIETVVVTPNWAGPALWHIVKGDSEIWILATVSPVPKDLRWDTTAVASLLKGSSQLILPPRANVGLLEGTWFLLTGMSTIEQPDGTTLESTMPEPLRGRFVATRTRIGQDADRYDELLGGVAALRLESDYWDFARLTADGPQKAVESLARREDVRVRAAAEYPAMDVVHAIPNMTPAAHLACLAYALDDIATESDHAATAAQAWSIGDLNGVKSHYSEIRLDDCLRQNSAYATLRETAHRDMTNAILEALSKPGKSFAVMPMGFFLRKGGVLDRLEAAGLTVSGPGG